MASGGVCVNALNNMLESPSFDEDILEGEDLNETLIPTWDDADEIVDKFFDDDEDGASSRHENDDGWNSSSVSGNDNDSSPPLHRTRRVAPWLESSTTSIAPFRYYKAAFHSSGESDDEEDSSSSDDDDMSFEGTDSNAENRDQSCSSRNNNAFCRGNLKDSYSRFSLPKHILQKSTNPKMTAATVDTTASTPTPLKSLQANLSNAVRSISPGVVSIRADLLERHQLPEVLDMIRSFAYATKRLVVEEVHQGAVVEALLIYLFEATKNDGSPSLQSLFYTGSWISPSLISYLATSERGLQELELGLSLYPKSKSNSRRAARRAQRANISRHLQRLEELEEAVAANKSLRVLRLLRSCHAKVTEGLIWAASCNQYLECLTLSVPVVAPQNTRDVHESGILIFEGLSEFIKHTSTLRDLSIYVDSSLCLLQKNSQEPLDSKGWGFLADSLSGSTHLERLCLEFGDNITKTHGMSRHIMRGIANNSSLQTLELACVPSECALDFWYGVETRPVPFQKVILSKSQDIVSYMTCLEDQNETGDKGWRTVSSFHLDAASLADDLFGLEIMAQSGGLKTLSITSTMSKKNADMILDALGGASSKVESLILGHDSPLFLTTFKSPALKSLELRGGRYAVSSDAICTLLDGCPALSHLTLNNVPIRGDLKTVRQHMESHALETFEIIERDE